MPERLKEIMNKIVEWWKKFTTKQRVLIISIIAVILLALIILAVIMTRPKMVELIQCEDTKEASEVQNLLDGAEIAYELSNDGLIFTINAKDEAQAQILLGSNDIAPTEPSIDDVFSGGFSTTSADKEKRYKEYREKRYASFLEKMDNVESASVSLDIPENDGTIISEAKPTYVAVKLVLSGQMTEEQAAGIARYLATSVGNDDTNNIEIIDGMGNTLFSGTTTSSVAGLTSTQLSYQTKVEEQMKSEVQNILKEAGVYSNVSIGLNLKLDFDQQRVTDQDYYVHEGQDQGYKTSESEYSSVTDGGTGGVPGTDTNDDTPTYVIEDGDTTHQEVTDRTTNYSPSVKVTETEKAVGIFVPDESSISVVATNYITYNEDVLKANGTLDDMSFEEFRSQNDQWVKTTADEELYSMVANATGIDTSNISILTYDVPIFEESQISTRKWSDYLQIALAVLILAMLGYVVYRSTKKDTVEEAQIEPELSVEELLASTKRAEEEELEDIGYNEKSETRVMIEKFVDENPEAVAALLRNWLNEEWN